MKNKSRWSIVLICDDKKDQKALLEALSKHQTISWNNNTVESKISREPGTVNFNISKSSIKPNRLRL